MIPNFIKKHLSDIRPYIIFSVIFFLLSFFIGYIFVEKNPEAAAKIIDEFKKMIEGAGEPSTTNLFLFIFLRNVFASFLVLLLGIILGIFPLLGLFANGVILGIVGHLFFSKISSALVFLAGILPHGIFELPAFFFSTATGLWLGVEALRWLIWDKERFGDKLVQSLKFFFFAVIPLLVLAALIESFITPRILALLIGG